MSLAFASALVGVWLGLPLLNCLWVSGTLSECLLFSVYIRWNCTNVLVQGIRCTGFPNTHTALSALLSNLVDTYSFSVWCSIFDLKNEGCWNCPAPHTLHWFSNTHAALSALLSNLVDTYPFSVWCSTFDLKNEGCWNCPAPHTLHGFSKYACCTASSIGKGCRPISFYCIRVKVSIQRGKFGAPYIISMIPQPPGLLIQLHIQHTPSTHAGQSVVLEYAPQFPLHVPFCPMFVLQIEWGLIRLQGCHFDTLGMVIQFTTSPGSHIFGFNCDGLLFCKNGCPTT